MIVRVEWVREVLKRVDGMDKSLGKTVKQICFWLWIFQGWGIFISARCRSWVKRRAVMWSLLLRQIYLIQWLNCLNTVSPQLSRLLTPTSQTSSTSTNKARSAPQTSSMYLRELTHWNVALYISMTRKRTSLPSPSQWSWLSYTPMRDRW